MTTHWLQIEAISTAFAQFSIDREQVIQDSFFHWRPVLKSILLGSAPDATFKQVKSLPILYKNLFSLAYERYGKTCLSLQEILKHTHTYCSNNSRFNYCVQNYIKACLDCVSESVLNLEIDHMSVSLFSKLDAVFQEAFRICSKKNLIFQSISVESGSLLSLLGLGIFDEQLKTCLLFLCDHALLRGETDIFEDLLSADRQSISNKHSQMAYVENLEKILEIINAFAMNDWAASSNAFFDRKVTLECSSREILAKLTQQVLKRHKKSVSKFSNSIQKYALFQSTFNLELSHKDVDALRVFIDNQISFNIQLNRLLMQHFRIVMDDGGAMQSKCSLIISKPVESNLTDCFYENLCSPTPERYFLLVFKEPGFAHGMCLFFKKLISDANSIFNALLRLKICENLLKYLTSSSGRNQFFLQKQALCYRLKSVQLQIDFAIRDKLFGVAQALEGACVFELRDVYQSALEQVVAIIRQHSNQIHDLCAESVAMLREYSNSG